jgi:hypothetical protein
MVERITLGNVPTHIPILAATPILTEALRDFPRYLAYGNSDSAPLLTARPVSSTSFQIDYPIIHLLPFYLSGATA